MYKKINQRGAILPIVVVIILLLGIIVSTRLINLKIPQIFKSRATADPITFKKADGTALPTLPNEGNLNVTDSLDVQLELNPPTP